MLPTSKMTERAHLRGNQNIAQVQAAKFFRRRFVLDRTNQTGARGLQRRRQAEQNPGKQRNHGGKQQHAHVHDYVRYHRHINWRTPDVHQVVEPLG